MALIRALTNWLRCHPEEYHPVGASRPEEADGKSIRVRESSSSQLGEE